MAGEYALIHDSLHIYEGKNFYPIAMEAREAPELANCKILYDKAAATTSYSDGVVALNWFKANKKVVLIPHVTHGSGASGTVTPVKKKKLVPTVLEVGDDF